MGIFKIIVDKGQVPINYDRLLLNNYYYYKDI